MNAPLGEVPRLRKLFLTTVDDRTTLICLHAAGQTVDADEEFQTLAGEFFAPPCHIHCRSIAIPVLDGMGEQQRGDAHIELTRRGRPDPTATRMPPPPPVDAMPQVMRPRPGWTPTPQRRWRAPPGLVAAAHSDQLTEWLPHMAWLQRRRAGVADPFPGQAIAGGVAVRQGFDGPATLLSRAELARHVAETGHAQLWRGLSRGDAEHAATGPLSLSPGIYGTGLYLTIDEDTGHRFTGPSGTVVTGALAAHARTITWVELERLVKTTRDHLTASQARRMDWLLRDPGVFAAAMGYDAIVLPDGDVLLLNRTALVLARGR